MWEVVLIEDWPCSNYEEQRQRERYWYDIYTDKLNGRHPYRSTTETPAHSAAYYNTNLEKIKARRTDYYAANKETFKAYYDANKNTIRAHQPNYYEMNKDTIKAQDTNYYEMNKDAIIE
jgi:hypothetical protein